MKNKTLRFTLVSLLMMVCGTAFADWQKTETLTVGDVVVMAGETQSATKELTAVTTSGTTHGTATDYTGTPAGTYPLTIVAGSAEGSIAFKTKDDTYLSWSSGNSLKTVGSVEAASSWTVAFSNGVATVTNVGTTARILQYNSGSPRFACYNSNQTKLTFWKQIAGDAVAKPNLPAATSFYGSMTVEITAEEGAAIYYTLDGNDPTTSSTQYTEAFTITETTTVKAIAVKDEKASAVATATYTAMPTYTAIAALTALENNATFHFSGEVLIVAKPTNKYMYIKDATGSSLIYDNNGSKIANAEVGKTIAANWTGKVSIYKKLFELVPDDEIVVKEGDAVEVAYPEVTVADITADNVNKVVTLKGITSYDFVAQNPTINVGEEQISGYNQFGLEIPAATEGKTYVMVGVISRYNDNIQFQPISINEEEQAEEDPDLVEIPQSQSPEVSDGANRADVVEGDGYTQYTTKGDISVIIKMQNIDVKDCDYVIVKFAEPVPASINIAFWNGNTNVAIPEGATEYKYVFADDENCAIVNDVLPQICILTLWSSGKVVKISGVFKHKAADPLAAAKEALQTAIAIASNINPEGLADAITAAQAALTAEGASAESIAQAAQTLEAAIKTYFGEVLPNLGAIVTALNEETLNTAYADAQAALAKEDVTPQELAAAMQDIITAAKAVAPEHLQNLKGYAVKYGATDAATLIDNALAAIEAGNVAQIIATMTAVKEAATPLAQQVLSGITAYVQAFGLTEQAAQAQAAMESGNYITMITTAKALFTHLVAAAKEYLPKLGDIATGLNDEALNTAYAAAQELLAKESITPEELGAAMQNIITAAKAVAPEHLQNLKGYAVKYGATDAATLIDNALAAIEAGNVSQIIATMTAVKEAATPLAQQVLSGITAYVQAFGLTEQAAQAQAAMESGNYITMITTAKALFTHLVAAAKEYLPKLGDIATGLNDEALNTAYAAAQELLAKESITPEELGAAMQNIITAAKAVAPEHLQNLKGYAVKYGAEDAVAKVDAALAAIEAGNVSQIIATMTAVKEAATPLATSILTQMIEDAQNYSGLEDEVTAARAALEGGNYITMIIAAKALYAKLVAVTEPFAVLTYKLGEQITTSMTVKKGDMTINITPEEGWTIETLTVNGTDKKEDFAEGKLTLSIDADTEVSVTFGWADADNLFTEDITTGIATIEGENVEVCAKDGQLCVAGAAGKSVRLYTIGGQLITNVTPSEGKTAKFSVPAGTYIVQVGSKAAKVVVK